MKNIAITAISITLLGASGLAMADGHADHETEIAKLQAEKSVLANRLRNAIAFSKGRAMQIEQLQHQVDAAQVDRKETSNRLRNAVAFSKERGKRIEMLQSEADSADSDRKELSTRLRNAIAFSKARGKQLSMSQGEAESAASDRKELSTRLRNAIAFSKARGMKLAMMQSEVDSASDDRKELSTRLRNAIAFSKERGMKLAKLQSDSDSAASDRKEVATRLRNAIAFSKERGMQIDMLQQQLDAARNDRKVLNTRLSNAITFSKERAGKIEMMAQAEAAESDWAANTSAVLDNAFGGLEGTIVEIESENNVKIQVGNNGLFRTSSVVLSSVGTQLLSVIAREVRNTDADLTVIGHSDNVPVGNSSRFSDNEELSFARAASTMQFLRTQGLSADRISAAGFGASNPIASNSTPEGRQQNRRVEIILKQR